MKMNPRIVFMGSPEFAVPILDMIARQYHVVGVVTNPDRPAGRGRILQASPVAKIAKDLNLDIFQPTKLTAPDSISKIKEWNPDLIIVAAYGQILRNEILNFPKHGCINIHASLLPRWRGASPIQSAILAGDEVTGITIMKMDPGMDTGPIYLSESLVIGEHDTSESLAKKLSELGANLLKRSLPSILSGKIIPEAQDSNHAINCKLIKKEFGKLDFNTQARTLERQIRAYYPWPGSFMDVNGIYVKVIKAKLGQDMQMTPGSKIIINGYPAICAVSGSIILELIQPAGKKIMTGKQFLQGQRNW